MFKWNTKIQSNNILKDRKKGKEGWKAERINKTQILKW